MSRSKAKKYRSCQTSTEMKQFANKLIRRTPNLADGNDYRRAGLNTWIINDSKRSRPIPKNHTWYIKLTRK
jgi:hypothetical protein